MKKNNNKQIHCMNLYKSIAINIMYNSINEIHFWSTNGTYNNGYFVIILAKNFRKLQSSIYLLLHLK